MFPCKNGSAWEISTPAKLNLYLDVLGKRDDGFHDLETLMVPVRIYDTLYWEDRSPSSSSPEIGLTLKNLCPGPQDTSLIATDNNLVLRAANLLAKSAGIVPCGQFTLIKRIPSQAGMGGGSSDAAATLLLMNQAWNLGYSKERLCDLGAVLGSDVPFFISSVPSICRGRGEILEAISGMPKFHFVIVKPPVGSSTAQVFSNYKIDARQSSEHKSPMEELVSLLRCGMFHRSSKWICNSLQPAATGISPWLGRLGNAFAMCGCWAHSMTGSGSAYFGIARNAIHARRMASFLKTKDLGAVYVTSSC